MPKDKLIRLPSLGPGYAEWQQALENALGFLGRGKLWEFYSYQFVPSLSGDDNVFGEIIFVGQATSANGTPASIAGVSFGSTGVPEQEIFPFEVSLASIDYKASAQTPISWDGTTITGMNLVFLSIPEEAILTQAQVDWNWAGSTISGLSGIWKFKSHWTSFIWPGAPSSPPIPQPTLGDFNQ